MSFPTDPLDRLIVFLGNRESVQRRTGFTAMADDYAAQLAAVQALRSELTAAQTEIAELRADIALLEKARDVFQDGLCLIANGGESASSIASVALREAAAIISSKAASEKGATP